MYSLHMCVIDEFICLVLYGWAHGLSISDISYNGIVFLVFYRIFVFWVFVFCFAFKTFFDNWSRNLES